MQIWNSANLWDNYWDENWDTNLKLICTFQELTKCFESEFERSVVQKYSAISAERIKYFFGGFS